MSSSARPRALLVLALLAGCSRETPAPATSALTAQAPQAAASSEAFPGQFAYRAAKVDIQDNNLRAAVDSLEQAIEQNPEFSEAYYQLGAAKTNLAIEQVRYDERSAIQLFREGVAAKRKAHHLMSLNKFYVWNEQQREQAWKDLREALRDVDAVLADETSLVAALKMYGS
jgi:tetratricopeptide (TPR) repeat protein